MPSLTIELTEQSLEDIEALARGRDQTPEEFLAWLATREVLTVKQALAVARQARENSGLSEDEAMELALEEVRAYRTEKAEWGAGVGGLRSSED